MYMEKKERKKRQFLFVLKCRLITQRSTCHYSDLDNADAAEVCDYSIFVHLVSHARHKDGVLLGFHFTTYKHIMEQTLTDIQHFY